MKEESTSLFVIDTVAVPVMLALKFRKLSRISVIPYHITCYSWLSSPNQLLPLQQDVDETRSLHDRYLRTVQTR